MSITDFNTLVGYGVLLLQVAAVALIVLYVLREHLTQKFLRQHALWLAFLLTLVGIGFTLVYSEYFGILPCGLCWLGRIALYPQAVLFGIAAYKRDTQIALYSIVLSAFGLIVSLYQHYLQMGGTSVLRCPASGVSDCAKRYLFEFGYVTLPLAGATIFVVLIVLMLFVRRHQSEQRTA